MKETHRFNFLVRIVISLVIPFSFAGLQVFSHGKSSLMFLWVLLLAFPIYSFFSLHIVRLDNELRLCLSFPRDIILKRILYKNITEIDAQRNLFFLTFYVRATSVEKLEHRILSQIFDTSLPVLAILPITNKRRDLLKAISEQNPAVKLDDFTRIFLSR